MSEPEAVSPASAGSWRDYGPIDLTPLLQGALSVFVLSGYHGATTRSLAAAAGLSVPGVYHHFESKQAILVALMRHAMNDLWTRTTTALEEAGESAEAQVDRYVECMVLFHANRSDLAFLASSEIRSLEPEARREHLASRDRQQQALDLIVEKGVAGGSFTAESPRDSSRAIVTMCTGVAQWYRPQGPDTPEVLASRYVPLVRRALGSAS